MAEDEDREYCNLLLDKVVNPDTPPAEIKTLLKELMAELKSDQMKELVRQIIECGGNSEHQKILIKQFKNWESTPTTVDVGQNGGDEPEEVYYKKLLDKYFDPNLPDYEYKPTMNKLLHGDLDKEKKDMVINIINTADAEQKQRMIQRFLNSFKKEEPPPPPPPKPKKVEPTELTEEELKEANRDFKELITKMIDPKTPVKMKRQIYGRLMEPDIDVDIKNLMVSIRYSTADEQPKKLEEFIALREREAREEEDKKRKAEEDRIKAIEDRKRAKEREKEDKINEKQKRLERKKLIDQIREERRLRDANKSEHELAYERQRRKEREKVRMEILKNRSEQNKFSQQFGGKLKPSRPDSDSEEEDQGWTIYRYPLTNPSPAQCTVSACDLVISNNLGQDDITALQMEIEKAKKSLAALGQKVKEKGERDKKDVVVEKVKKEESQTRENSEEKKESTPESEKAVKVESEQEKKPEVVVPVQVKEPTEEELGIIRKSIKLLKKDVPLADKKGMLKNLMDTEKLDLVTNFLKNLLTSAPPEKAEKIKSWLALSKEVVESKVKADPNKDEKIEISENKIKSEEPSKETVNGDASSTQESKVDDTTSEDLTPKPEDMDLIKKGLKRLKKSQSNDDIKEVFKKLMDIGKHKVLVAFLKGILSSADAEKAAKIKSWLKIASEMNEVIKKVETNNKIEKRKLSTDQNDLVQANKKPKISDSSEVGKIESKRKSNDEDHTEAMKRVKMNEGGEKLEEASDEEKEDVPSVDVSTLTMEELRSRYSVDRLDCFVKAKNDRIIYRSIIAIQEKIDAKARADSEKREREEEEERISKAKQMDIKSEAKNEEVPAKVENVKPQVLKIDKNGTEKNGDSRSRSVSRSVSRSPSRSVSRSPSRSVSRSRSPSRSVSRSPSRSRSR